MPDPTPTPTPTDPAASPPPAATTPPPAATTPPPSEPPADPPRPDGDEALGGGGKRALQAERDARKAAEKAAADALAKVKEFEDANLTEQQRLEKERDDARESATTNAQKVALLQAALDYGLDKDDLELLDGVPADQIDARAKRLSERIAAGKAPGTPKPDPSQGSRGGVDIDARIQDATEKGDVMEAIRLKNLKFTSN